MKKTGLREDAAEDIKVRKPEEKHGFLRELLSWIRTIAIGVIIGVLLVIFVVQRDNVCGDSMYPTLHDGYVVFTQKIATYFKDYDRGDIVILDGENMEGYNHDEYLIKRIIGLPGETVRISEGNVYIRRAGEEDFYLLDEKYLQEGVETVVMQSGLAKGYDEITLGDDEYYCMGDNRPVSNDSRNLGPFSEDRIKGIAFVVIYPFSAFGTL